MPRRTSSARSHASRSHRRAMPSHSGGRSRLKNKGRNAAATIVSVITSEIEDHQPVTSNGGRKRKRVTSALSWRHRDRPSSVCRGTAIVPAVLAIPAPSSD
jgi:hypothetical protein